MARTVSLDKTFWLAGYYDDFTGAVALADDQNTANSRTIDHTLTHYGSAIGGINMLSPRFKYSYPDRKRTGHYASGDTVFDEDFYAFLSNQYDYLTHNDGLHKWMTKDSNLRYNLYWEGKAQQQIPISIVANRFKWYGESGDSYLSFVN